jgi:hypothetical protein
LTSAFGEQAEILNAVPATDKGDLPRTREALSQLAFVHAQLKLMESVVREYVGFSVSSSPSAEADG